MGKINFQLYNNIYKSNRVFESVPGPNATLKFSPSKISPVSLSTLYAVNVPPT